MSNQVVINSGDHDIRAAFLEDGTLVEFHQENFSQRSLVGNIYRGVVQDVVPGLQAAFVDVGLSRNLFLHFMDIRPESLVMHSENLEEALLEASHKTMPGRIERKGRRPLPDLRTAGRNESPVKRGDSIIVQVIKDGIGDKAPRATTNLAIAGRYVVLLPFPGQSGGVSRRIGQGQERQQLRKLLQDLRSDYDSFIMRTAGLGAEEDQVRGDVESLRQAWKDLATRFRSTKRPGLVHSDHEIVPRLVRDVFTEDLDEIFVDDDALKVELEAALCDFLPALSKRIHVYTGDAPIFEHHGVEKQLRGAYERKVWLKSGGYIIIDETEALTAIDVNTGKFTGHKDQEKTSFRTNMEACETIAQQIRLRDLGGIIVIDFIDMLSQDNKVRVYDEFRHHMRHDRAKSAVGRLGDFGLLMLTRKRKHKSLQNQVFEDCPYCVGEGRVLRPSELWRRVSNDIHALLRGTANLSGVIVTCQPAIVEHLKKDYAETLRAFEDEHEVDILLRSDPFFHRDDYQLTGVERPRGAVALPSRRVAREEVETAPIAYEERPHDLVAVDDHVEEPELAAAAVVASVATVQPSAPSPQADDEESEGEHRKRTRRGRRGGRRRRRGLNGAEEGAVGVASDTAAVLSQADEDDDDVMGVEEGAEIEHLHLDHEDEDEVEEQQMAASAPESSVPGEQSTSSRRRRRRRRRGAAAGTEAGTVEVADEPAEEEIVSSKPVVAPVVKEAETLPPKPLPGAIRHDPATSAPAVEKVVATGARDLTLRESAVQPIRLRASVPGSIPASGTTLKSGLKIIMGSGQASEKLPFGAFNEKGVRNPNPKPLSQLTRAFRSISEKDLKNTIKSRVVKMHGTWGFDEEAKDMTPPKTGSAKKSTKTASSGKAVKNAKDAKGATATSSGAAKKAGAKKAGAKKAAGGAKKASGAKKAAGGAKKAGAKKAAGGAKKAGAKKAAGGAKKAGAKKAAGGAAKKAGAKKAAGGAKKASGAKKAAGGAKKAGAKKAAGGAKKAATTPNSGNTGGNTGGGAGMGGGSSASNNPGTSNTPGSSSTGPGASQPSGGTLARDSGFKKPGFGKK